LNVPTWKVEDLRERAEGQDGGAGFVEVLGDLGSFSAQRVDDPVELTVTASASGEAMKSSAGVSSAASTAAGC
jgi:hypothetical protein